MVKDRSKNRQGENYPRSVQYGTVQTVLQVISIYLHQRFRSGMSCIVLQNCTLQTIFYSHPWKLTTSLSFEFQNSRNLRLLFSLEDIIFLIREMKLTEIYISLKVKNSKFIISFYIYKFLTGAVEQNDVQKCLFEIFV